MDLINRAVLIDTINNIKLCVKDPKVMAGLVEMKAKVLREIENAPAVNQWISVEAALPEQSEEGQPPNVKCSDCVLVAASDWIGMAYYVTYGEESQWEFADAQNKPKIDWVDVTHWMLLPEQPNEKDESG